MAQEITFGILTVSDSCSKSLQTDKSGPALEAAIQNYFTNSSILFKKIVPDEKEKIIETLLEWSRQECNVILTTGGTGFAPRDVTPEATKSVIEKEAPAMAQALISKSLAVTEMAMLSRLVCGIKNKSLIINFPGSSKAATECFDFVKVALPHAVALITEKEYVVKSDHKIIQNHVGSSTSEPSKVRVNCVAQRARKSNYPMIEVDDAVEIVIRQCIPTQESEEIPIELSLNRVLAEDVFSKDPLPPFRASIKDGYAVIAEDGQGLRTVRNVTAAGDAPIIKPLARGEAVRISTGAPLPEGADCVIQVEDTVLKKVSVDGLEEEEIEITSQPKVGLDIREIGSDIPANSKVLEKFNIISSSHVGVLATIGRTRVEVTKQATVGVISTGNELVSHTEVLTPGKIRDCNKLALMNLLKEYNYNAVDCGIARDSPNSVKHTLSVAFSACDVILTTGGVSMGEFDLIKKVLEVDFQAKIHFGRINMKPGKPTTFASLVYEGRRKLVFGLPGNPVSACVTALLFVIPALRFLENRPVYKFPEVDVDVREIVLNDERPSYVRAHIKYKNGALVGETTGNQISSRINSLIGANGLVIAPANYKRTSNKETFKGILFGTLGN